MRLQTETATPDGFAGCRIPIRTDLLQSFLANFHGIITMKSIQSNQGMFFCSPKMQCLLLKTKINKSISNHAGRCTQGEKVDTCRKLTGFHQNLSLFDVTVSLSWLNSECSNALNRLTEK